MTYSILRSHSLDVRPIGQYALLGFKVLLMLTVILLMTACDQTGGATQTDDSGATSTTAPAPATASSAEASTPATAASPAAGQAPVAAQTPASTPVTSGAQDSGGSAKASNQVIASLVKEYPAPIKTPRPLSSKPPQKRVIASGYADPTLPNPEQAAIEDALRKAVKHVGGMELGAISESRNFAMVEDVIYTRSTGYIEKHQVLEKTPRNKDGLYQVKVEAVVSKGSIDFEIALFKSVLKRMGTPEIMVLRTVDEARLPPAILTKIQGQFKEKGLRVIDPDMSLLNRAKEARRADKVDQDIVKAALISDKLPCDILALVNFEGETRPSVPVAGTLQFPARAQCSIRLIRVDSAEALANATAEVTKLAPTINDAEQKASHSAAESAIQIAMQKIAKHWLEELNDNGHWIKLKTHKFSFDRTMTLSSGLKEIPAILEVQNKSIDEDAVGDMRIRTTLKTDNLGMIIKRLDRSMKIGSLTRYGIDLK